MKKQIIRIIFTLCVICLGTAAMAQLKIGVNAGVGFPTGALGSFSKVGYGAGITGEYLLLDKHLGLGINAHYTSFGFRYLAEGGHTTMAPITVFAKYYLSTDAVRPFVGVDVGEYYVNIPSVSNPGQGASFNPGLAPMGGFVFQLSDQVDFNLTAKYNISYSSTFQQASTFTFLGITAGTAITFGK